MTEKERREKREYKEACRVVDDTIDTLLTRYRVPLLRQVLDKASNDLRRKHCEQSLIEFREQIARPNLAKAI